MNAYDFDKTIYNGDSTFHFFKFILKKHPHLIPSFLVKSGYNFILYRLKKITKTKMKEQFYSIFTKIDAEALLCEFWDTHEKNIKKFYMENQRDDDLIISASPEFLLAPICKRLGITHLIASRVDVKTGKYTGENCWGEEKVVRFKEVYGDAEVGEFYSDSYSDTPMARLARTAYLVKGDKLLDF